MKIEYANSDIQALFSDLEDVTGSKNLLQKKIGLQLTKKTKMRITQIKAAQTLQKYIDFHIGNPHTLTGDLDTYVGVDLDKHIRLIIQPVPPDTSAEALKICEVAKIIGIVDYHGGKNEWLIA